MTAEHRKRALAFAAGPAATGRSIRRETHTRTSPNPGDWSGASGDPLFHNRYRACKTPAEPVRKMIDCMTAIHDGDRVWRGRQKKTVAGELPRSEHAVVRIHPVSGRRELFVKRNFTEHIVGLSRLESDAILDRLYRHSERDDFICA